MIGAACSSGRTRHTERMQGAMRSKVIPRAPKTTAVACSCTRGAAGAAQGPGRSPKVAAPAAAAAASLPLTPPHPSMLHRRDLHQRLLSAAWQAAAAAQQRGAHRAAGKSGGAAGSPRAPPSSNGRHSSSSTGSDSGDQEAVKRERRRQRRVHNRELRERLCLNSAGFDFAASWQASVVLCGASLL